MNGGFHHRAQLPSVFSPSSRRPAHLGPWMYCALPPSPIPCLHRDAVSSFFPPLPLSSLVFFLPLPSVRSTRGPKLRAGENTVSRHSVPKIWCGGKQPGRRRPNCGGYVGRTVFPTRPRSGIRCRAWTSRIRSSAGARTPEEIPRKSAICLAQLGRNQIGRKLGASPLATQHRPAQ